MSYTKASELLPKDLIEIIQNYIDGEYIYIPKKDENKKAWGENSPIKEELNNRNEKIYKHYISGTSVTELANIFYLSEKSIQRIILAKKKEYR